MTALHRELRRHAHDSKLLDLCSGLQHLIERFDAVLAEYAAGDGPALDSQLVDAVLGAIAIRDRLAHAFAAPAVPAHEEAAHPHAPESLLR